MNYPQIKPTLNLDFSNTKTLDPRINFRRGTPGAYYDGKTHAKAEENLLSYSENFNDTENYWAEVRASLTGSEESPVDSTSGYKLSQTLTGVAGVLLVTTGKIKLQIGKQYVSSVYVKADNSNYFAIAEEVSRNNPTGSGAFTYFNLSNSGEVMLSHENHIASIQNVGNQWYRCSVMFTAEIEEDYTVMFYLDSGSNQSIISEPQNVASGSSVYLWGAQLEQRDSVTAYTPTNGNPITKYQPQLMFASPDQPRFDHDVLTGESKGLLIEESRKNLIEYSEDISAWTGYGDIILNKNFTVAPDGVSLANSIIRYNEPDNSIRPGQHIYQALIISSSDNVTTSFYAKSINGANVTLNNGACVVLYDLKDQTYTVLQNDNNSAFISATITHVGNDWYRCTTISIGSGVLSQFQFSPWLSSTEKNWEKRYTNGDNISGLYIWGIQVEIGSFPTSYIKTSGAPSGTERSADNASITGENFSSWYRQDEGSLYIDSEIHESRTTSTYEVLSLYMNSSNFISVSSTGRELIGSIYTNSSTQSQFYNELKSQIPYTINTCFGYKEDSVSLYNKGEQIGVEDTSASIPSAIDRLFIGNRNGSYWSGRLHIKKLSYYPQRLTNEQLQQLTK